MAPEHIARLERHLQQMGLGIAVLFLAWRHHQIACSPHCPDTQGQVPPSLECTLLWQHAGWEYSACQEDTIRLGQELSGSTAVALGKHVI